MALSPVLDQLAAAHRRGRRHAPPPRHDRATFADLIDGPLAHITSGLFAANCAWLVCAVITHNLLRAAGTLAGGDHAIARRATLRRDLVNVPARFAAPARKPTLHLPIHWPRQLEWKTLWHNVIGYPTIQPRAARPNSPVLSTPRHPGPTKEPKRKAGTGQQITHPHRVHTQPRRTESRQSRLAITDPRIQA